MRLGGDGFAGEALRAASVVLDESGGERAPAERVSGVEPLVCSVLVYEASGSFAATWCESLQIGGISAVVAAQAHDALRLLGARVFDVAIVGFDVACASTDFARPFRACMREGRLVFVVEHLRAEDVLGAVRQFALPPRFRRPLAHLLRRSR